MSFASIIVLRDWFPVCHSGYYAIVGFNESTNGLIMSEPIINVQACRRVFESTRKCYKINGNYSILTLTLFNNDYDCSYDEVIEWLMQNFDNGLPADWIKSIHHIQMVVDIVTPLYEFDYTKKAWYGKPFLRQVMNNSFKEIQDPTCSYYKCNIRDIQGIRHCFDRVFTMIKENQENWRMVLSHALRDNDHNNVIEKLKEKMVPEQHIADIEINLSYYKSLIMWFPERDSSRQNYYITGYLLNENKELEEFRSKIVHVNKNGIHIHTENQPVKLQGPICTIKIEKSPNVFIINSLVKKHIGGLFCELPPYWKGIVTVIDVAMSMKFNKRHEEPTIRISDYFKHEKPDENCIEYLFYNVYFMIKNKKENWRSVLSDGLKNRGYNNVMEKLKEKMVLEQPIDDIEINLPNYKSLIMWCPERDSATQSYSITGYIINENYEVEEFRSKIVYVNEDGVHIHTEDQPVKLCGHISTIQMEVSPKALRSVVEHYMFGINLELPTYWKDILTVIDIAMSLEVNELL